jgi:uncharacterized protein
MEIGFDYTRSLGPTLSQFMAALADRRILGARDADGRVHAPPFEYDPATSAPPTELVPVGTEGTVTTWSWVPQPLEGQPLAHPFAWALIRLDGADTVMLHAVDAGSAGEMRSGMRVRVRWASPTVGDIRDIACFDLVEPMSEPKGRGPDWTEERGSSRPSDELAEPKGRAAVWTDERGREERAPERGGKTAVKGDGEVGGAPEASRKQSAPEASEPVAMLTTPVRLHYEHAASPTETSFLRGLADGRLLAQRCPACGKVYIPPRGACPTDGVPTADEVELPDHGIVTTFCVVNVPYPGQRVTPPYVAAAVLLEGADIPFQHLILGCDPDEVRMGMRVQAVWKPRDEWGTTMENIDHFRPTGEPDAPYETYAHHL